MTLPSGAHVSLAGVEWRLDQDAPLTMNRPAYRHWSRSLFSPRTDITGRPGSQNLNPDLMRWDITDFDGEGQVVLRNDDPDSARLFYRSEGLDAKIPGTLRLNRSTILQSPQDATGGASATSQGDAWSDVTGTSTLSGTDRRLNVVNDVIKSATHTPGVGRVEATFHLYKADIAKTAVQGNTFTLISGEGNTTGTDFVLKEGLIRSANLTGLTANRVVRVSGTMSWGGGAGRGQMMVYNSTNDRVVAAIEISEFYNPDIWFIPAAGKSYQVRFRWHFAGYRLTVDKIEYWDEAQLTTVRCSVYNETGATEVNARLVTLSNTATAAIVSIPYTAAAATNYTYRVRYDSGPQLPWVDKSVAVVRSTSVWTLDHMGLGQGGKTWLVGSRAGVDSQTWTYDYTNEDWDVQAAVTGASNRACYAMAHTDAYQYLLMSDAKVYQQTTALTDDYTAAITGVPVGMCIAQDRLFVLCEDSTNGIIVRTFAVDAAVGGGPTAEVSNVTVTTAKNTADTTLRQRMVGTPTGARFFVNYSDARAIIYEADASGQTLTARPIAELEPGAFATAIAHVGGLTFVAGQFLAEGTQTARSGLWLIDQNSTVRFVGYFRRDDPDSRIPKYMVPYQRDLWILQGNFVWRYSLSTGGIFLEYQLSPTTPGNQVALAVGQGHTHTLYSDEGVFTTGSVGTYRQAGSNQYISSVYDFGLPGFNKTLDTIQVLTDSAATATNVKVEYQADQDGTWVHVGTVNSGSLNTFQVSTEDSTTTFANIQIRITLTSETGVNTPILKAIIVAAFPSEKEEYLDLVLRCEDEDSSDHPAGLQRSGTELAGALRGLWRAGAFMTLLDGYESETPGSSNEYLVRIDDFDEQFTDAGEGRLFVRLRVIG